MMILANHILIFLGSKSLQFATLLAFVVDTPLQAAGVVHLDRGFRTITKLY